MIQSAVDTRGHSFFKGRTGCFAEQKCGDGFRIEIALAGCGRRAGSCYLGAEICVQLLAEQFEF
ncbi:hypothetical protein D3C72_2425480 [compost metagenome]